MATAQYHLKFDGNAGAAVDSYLEYHRIVRDDDGGTPFTPEQFEAYKKRVFPMRLENRLFVSWSNQSGMACKQVGPETQCFCTHRYYQHKTDFASVPPERPVMQPCKVRGCRCTTYSYLPANGPRPTRCRCKHEPGEHAISKPHRCQKEGCACTGFSSAYTCGCGAPAHAHMMLTETKAERLERGMPVGRDVPYQAMGGLTGFSSLMDGYERMDPSGIGPPPPEVLNAPITSSDHPFLRANVNSIKAYKMINNAPDVDADLAECMSAMKRPGESDMDFYERRYQERLKAERAAARGSRSGVGQMRKPAVTRGPKPSSDQSSMSISGSKAGTSGPKPGTSGPKPGTSGPKPGTRNKGDKK